MIVTGSPAGLSMNVCVSPVGPVIWLSVPALVKPYWVPPLTPRVQVAFALCVRTSGLPMGGAYCATPALLAPV